MIGPSTDQTREPLTATLAIRVPRSWQRLWKRETTRIRFDTGISDRDLTQIMRNVLFEALPQIRERAAEHTDSDTALSA